MNKIFAQLLEKRHLDSEFLHPDYKNLTDPYELPDCKKAITRIKKALKNHENVLIYGDYDVDGITASTVMEQALILAGAKPENLHIMLPDRFADGYGMSPKLIEVAKKYQITLVITVDCGSSNHEIIAELNHLGIDTIVTDHHETKDTLPEAIAIVNPKRRDFKDQHGLRDLAGVGVAFKIAEALKKAGLIENEQEKWLLDLVLLGTICDNMLLTHENRILSYFGLKVLTKTRRPGLKSLMQKAGVKNLNADAIGFQIGPRLNAAGRLDTADLSLNLLRAKDAITAAPLVEKLETLNQKRKTEQLFATKEIKKRGVKDDPVIIETGHWHEGILGIVAGHLVEDYHKPAFVLTELDNNIFKGSGRSFGDFNLAKALDYAKDSIINGGGHAGAAGVKVDGKNLYQFREKINHYYTSLHLKDQTSYFGSHADLDLEDFSDLDLDLLEQLKLLEPFGPGDEEPIFRLRNVTIKNLVRMGAERNHLRLDLEDRNGKFLKLVAFYAPEKWFTLDPELDRIEPLIKLTENEFSGVKSLEARIIDINML
ncbi:single-stranded-DNA-specific exonuclease RecJ [Candidatus Saccharibacteria bacterium]|nr:single-stranded-DNA-specific exonuclease RecJ [Candidatus Saccharibacteria bacterium]